ncbi:MAG: amino acid ABC transporter ATP-binding protein [Victivallaceae bacterium]|nr:amino acid ABC transporter ATP-binding protein [Victivallaceae bacterium]
MENTDNTAPLFKIRNIVKRFGSVTAVDDVSLDIRRGEALFIVGSSGSGKSTFLRCLNFLEIPDSGTIRFDGAEVAAGDRTLDAYRSLVGMVFQHFNLFPHLTVRRNITLAPLLTGRMTPEEADDTASTLLRRVGLADKSESYPDQLSGGQKQRIAIVRALAMRPEALLFDEPTSALDPEMVGEVLGVMRELVKDGMTMAVVTHEIDFACELADRMIFMEKGRIRAQGTPDEVVRHPADSRIAEFFTRLADKRR